MFIDLFPHLQYQQEKSKRHYKEMSYKATSAVYNQEF